MPHDRSDKVYEYWREASQRFDYFITGISGALTAYIGQSIHPTRIGFNTQSVELLALTFLVVSVVLGFKRIEANVGVFKLMHNRLFSEEARGSLIKASQGGNVINTATGNIYSPEMVLSLAEGQQLQVEAIKPVLEQWIKRSDTFYKWRNRFLIGGFLILVVSKILPAYLG